MRGISKRIAVVLTFCMIFTAVGRIETASNAQGIDPYPCVYVSKTAADSTSYRAADDKRDYWIGDSIYFNYFYSAGSPSVAGRKITTDIAFSSNGKVK